MRRVWVSEESRDALVPAHGLKPDGFSHVGIGSWNLVLAIPQRIETSPSVCPSGRGFLNLLHKAVGIDRNDAAKPTNGRGGGGYVQAVSSEGAKGRCSRLCAT